MANVAAPFRNIVLAAFAFAVLSSTAGTVAAEAVGRYRGAAGRARSARGRGRQASLHRPSTQEFERVGEYVMGRMPGSTSAYRSMNDLVPLMAALVGLVALALWRWRPAPDRSGGSPLQALGCRFAAGEIDADEYQRRRQALGGPA